ncbi:DoxX family protein [Mucilaginibacter terrae]|uniref:Membrane protein n=1 Tax=Mucilaginibacter terrae TaxID=1955052 RepID=A0ABU3GXZ2_9SPHI|nr:DoxX family protein [Mucilaginibacter terrae]MDT3404637.1 putative membrane protein [Mucilaginibacter terrae]
MLKKISLVILIIAYVAAGINHFIHPDGYIDIIPYYLPYPNILNYVAGACEVAFGLMLIFPQSRNLGLTLLIIMLAAFLPVHIAMVQAAPTRVNGYLITPLIAWLRLFLQPLLMMWLAWHHETKK